MRLPLFFTTILLVAAGCVVPDGRLDATETATPEPEASPAPAEEPEPGPESASEWNRTEGTPPPTRANGTAETTAAPEEASAPVYLPAAPTGTMSAFWRRVEDALALGRPVTVEATHNGDAYGLISTGASEFEVLLRRSHALHPAFWAEVDGVRVQPPPVWAYEGHVAGEPDRLVRLVIADSWARGSVRVGDDLHLIRMGLNGNLPASAPGAFADAQGPRFETEASGRTRAMYEPRDHAEEDCWGFVPPYVKPMAELGRAKDPPLTFDLVLDGDRAFGAGFGRDAFPLMVAMMQEADAIYDHEVGVRLRVVGLHLHTDPEMFPTPGDLLDVSPLAALAEHWNTRPGVARDVVYLFMGVRSDSAQANCIGGMGHPEVAYAFSPVEWETHPGSFHVRAVAHELGHLFAAHHHYGNHVETLGATLMIQGYTPGDRPVFSTLTKSVIRGWAENARG